MLSSVPYATGYTGQQIQGHHPPLPSAYQSQISGSYRPNKGLASLEPMIKLEDDIELHGPSSTPPEKTSAPDADDDSIFEDFCTPKLFTSPDKKPNQVSNVDEDIALSRSLCKETSGSSSHDTIAARPSPGEPAREGHQAESSVGNANASPAKAKAT